MHCNKSCLTIVSQIIEPTESRALKEFIQKLAIYAVTSGVIMDSVLIVLAAVCLTLSLSSCYQLI